MPSECFGDGLNRIIFDTKALIFKQGELVQLTHEAFRLATGVIVNEEKIEFELSYPIGFGEDGVVLQGKITYTKENLLAQYSRLTVNQLAINSLFHLVTLMEAMFSDLVRKLVLKYPDKLGNQSKMPMQLILESQSIEEIHIKATDLFLHELSYKSPSDFADSLQKMFSINLLECPYFHKYIEIKATRDIWIHNRGIANDIYVKKSASHQRVIPGRLLPVDLRYYLQSYECCLKLAEWLESKLHEKWHSQAYEAFLSKSLGKK
jgi:hypothetical protein